MATLADSLVSSTARPLSMRMRADLKIRQTRYQGTQYWVIKDPVALNYYRFQEEEFLILQWLDGTTSLDDLKRRFEKRFAPQKIHLDELGRLIGTLHRSNLVIADLPGQGPQLLERRGEKNRQKLFGTMSNILAIRFKGIDPERILKGLLPLVRWFFSPWAATFCILFGLSALMLVAVNFETFQTKLPSFQQFFAAKNWIWLALAMGMTKVIHEFGHGLSCKYFGGECHEMGAMLLVFTPCLYCNVSDSWMLPNKWHRAMIGAAGMYVELVIASFATYVWWFSEPGMLNQLALSTMFVCSVSTLLFNANPLMRYDGYYILSDLTEIPNLRQKASAILHRKLGAWCLGLKEPYDPFLPERNQWFFALYSVAAAIYSWVITFSILWFLYEVFKPYRLQILGQMLAMMSLVSLVGIPLYKMGRFFYLPGRIDQVKKARLLATLAIIAALIAAVLFVPLPYYVICPVEIKASQAAPVYVEVSGNLTELYVKPGEQVVAGQKLAELANVELNQKLLETTGRRDQLRVQEQTLQDARFVKDSAAVGQLAVVRQSLATLEEQLEKMQQDQKKLTLLAPKAGTVIAPPDMPSQADRGRLPSWSGSPLERQNIGATFRESTLFCNIGNPKQMDAIMVISQSEIDFVHPGQKVDLLLDALPGEYFPSEITLKSTEKLEYAPKQLSNKSGGDIETTTDSSGMERPIVTSYQALAPLEDETAVIRPGMRGRAKIRAGSQTLGARFGRYLQETFNFRM